MHFGVDYFSTNQRTKAVKDWLAKNRPDIKIKQVDFTDPSKVSHAYGCARWADGHVSFVVMRS